MEQSFNTDSRTRNSLRNMGTSILGQVINNIIKLVCRVAFVHTLGKEYLGISSLYANVLTLLSVAELGFSTAITFSLYKPLAEGDEEKVRSLMAFFKNVYRIIGLVVFGLGLCLIPFLPSLMTGVTEKVNIYLYYILYLIQTSVSYLFFAYKAVLLTADQKKYLADLVQYVVQIVMNVVQIFVLFIFESFLAYTIISIVFTIIQNILTAVVVDRKYPFLKAPAKPLDDKDRKTVFQRVYAAALYKIASAVGTGTDHLIISKFLNIVVVGIYDNYYTIIGAVQTALTGIMRSFLASLGNLYVLESKEKNEFMFRALNLVNYFIVTLCSVEFLSVFQPFIRLLYGADYLLDSTVLWIVVYNFATNYMELIVNMYNESSGTFVRGKYRAVFSAVINLVVSIILVQKIGLAGVFLGSIISRMVTIWWYDALLLYHHGFEMSAMSYFLNYFLHAGLIAGLGIAVYFLSAPLNGVSSLIQILYRGVISLLLVVGVYWLLFHKTEEYHYAKEKVQELVHKRKKK